MPNQNVTPAITVRLATFARRQARLRIDPVANRARGNQREAEREGNRIARERGKRRRLIANAGVELAQGEPVIAGQGKEGHDGQKRRRRNLVGAGRRDCLTQSTRLTAETARPRT